jgi:hypothetical protein
VAAPEGLVARSPIVGSLMARDLAHMVHFRCRPSSSSSMLMLPSQVWHTVIFRLIFLTIMFFLSPRICPAKRAAGNGSHERRRETPAPWGVFCLEVLIVCYCSMLMLYNS